MSIEWLKRTMEKRKNNLVNAISDDNRGESVFREHDFIMEEILDMPTEGEVLSESILTSTVCTRHNDLCKNESHGKCNHGIFCVTGKDLEFIDIDSIFDNDKMVI